MKKTPILLILPFLLIACQNNSESAPTQNSEKESNTESLPFSENISEKEEDTNSDTTVNHSSRLNITYVMENGQFISRETKTVEIGSTYSFPLSLSIPFMLPDKTEITGIKKEEEEYIDITYSYSGEPIESPSSHTEYKDFLADEELGLSFSFIAECTKWGDTLLKSGDFALKNNGLFLSDSQLDVLEAYGEENFSYQSFVTKEEERALYTFSFSKEKAVFYKNSHRVLTFFNNRTEGNKEPVYSTIYQSMIKSIKENGIRIGDDIIHDFRLNKALGEKDVTSLASSYLITEAEYFDENGILLERDSRIGKEPYTYSFPELSIPGYQSKSNIPLQGETTESKTIRIQYQFNGKEQLKKEVKLDRSSSYGWDNESQWLKYATDLEEDFTMKVNLKNYGSSSYTSSEAKGGEVCWRTALPIVYDSKTKDLWVTRFDWYGWLSDKNNDNKNLGTGANYNNSQSYVFNYDKDIYPIYKEMDVELTYQRKGSTLTMSSLIKPKRSPYLGQEYSYTCILYGIETKKLSFALSAEDSIVILQSVRY